MSTLAWYNFSWNLVECCKNSEVEMLQQLDWSQSVRRAVNIGYKDHIQLRELEGV